MLQRILTVCAVAALSMATAVTSYSQEKYEVTGTVADNIGPVIGASVMEQGTTNGNVTDFDGTFTLKVSSKDAIIEISCIGYATATFKASEMPSQILLSEDTQFLDEVVVIGYGTLEKKNVTSSITSVSPNDLIAGQGGASIGAVLNGKISGMNVKQDASPNSETGFQLRGVASINASSEPLVVVDGMPGADINAIDFEDVESIDVLKDASAGAIYGTRAAAGVILITTKKSAEGKMKLTYNTELATEMMSNYPDILTADEFLKADGADFGYKTDWYSAILQEWKLSQKHTVTLSGGSKAAQVHASATYMNQPGIALGDNREDISGRINGKFNVAHDLIQINIHTSYRQAERDRRSSTDNFATALRMNPTESILDETTASGYNMLTGNSHYYNPVADIELKKRNQIDRWLNADATVKLNLPFGFSASVTGGWQLRQTEKEQYTSPRHLSSIEDGTNGKAHLYHGKNIKLSLEPTINWNKSFADHSIDAVAGYSFYEENASYFNVTNYNFPYEATGAWDIDAGDFITVGKSKASDLMESYKSPRIRLISFFGRVNYNYKSRYVFSGTVRREGTSKFGADHRWGTFWALSGGWRISSEPWMQGASNFLDDLKLRVGYGVTGNSGFGAGMTATTYTAASLWPLNGNWITSYGPTQNVNYDLHWEEKAELNLGIDYAFFGNRLYGKFDIYRRWISGMIYNIPVASPPAVHNKTIMNYGDLENWGWEFEIGGVPVRVNDFEWSTSVRLSNNESKITSLWGKQTYQDRVQFPAPNSFGKGGRLESGTQIGSYYLYKYAGMSEDGNWMVYNKDGNVILYDNAKYEDKRYIGDAIPALIFSWDHKFTWKDLYLAVDLRSWIDFDVLNTLDMYYGIPVTPGWNTLRSAYTKNAKFTKTAVPCDYFIEDGSFLSIDAISIGYNLDMKKWQKYIDNIGLYFTVKNVARLTKYSGFTPEVNINGLDPGYDWFNAYPETRRFTFGAKITF